MSSLFRKNTATSSWLARLTGLLSGIQEAKEPIGPLTDICAAVGVIVERKRVSYQPLTACVLYLQ